VREGAGVRKLKQKRASAGRRAEGGEGTKRKQKGASVRRGAEGLEKEVGGEKEGVRSRAGGSSLGMSRSPKPAPAPHHHPHHRHWTSLFAPLRLQPDDG
jgi:hypothetical protein